MGLIALVCQKCGASLRVDEQAVTYTCKYCQTVHEREHSGVVGPTPHSLQIVADRAFARGEYGKAMQLVEQGLAIDPHHGGLLDLEARAKEKLLMLAEKEIGNVDEQIAAINLQGEAEQYCLQAQFILNELQANKKVYGSNSSLTGATPANVDLALQYIDRAIENIPNSPIYLNLKALLLWEGKGNKEAAKTLLEQALVANPRDINIQNNLNALKSSPCFIATAAFGTPMAAEVEILRAWRDQCLTSTRLGKAVISAYYWLSPPIANFIAPRPKARRRIRALIRPLIKIAAVRAFGHQWRKDHNELNP